MSFIAKLKSMPSTLAGLTCLFLICGALCIMGALFPNRITRAELWSSWDGLIILITGIVMMMFSLSVLRRIRWIRYLWPTIFAVMLVHSLIVFPEEVIEQILALIVWFMISSWYFFRKKTVVHYFNQAVINKTSKAEGSSPQRSLSRL